MKRTIAILAMVVVLGGALVYNMRARMVPPRTSAAVADAGLPGSADAPVPVTVASARRRTVSDTLALVGVLKAGQEAGISAKVPSRILSVLVRDGQAIRAGQALVRLDIGDYGAQVAGARAAVAAAEAQYRKAIDGKRARTLELDGQIAQAQGGLRTALAKQRQAELSVPLTSSSARSDVERAEAGVKQAEAGLRQADLGLKVAVDTLERVRYVYARGGVSRADLEGAQAQVDIATAQRESALAGLAQARAGAKPAAESAPLRTQVSEADVEAARAGVMLAQDGLRSARKAKAEALHIADRDIEAARAQVEQARAGSDQAAAQVGGSVLTSPYDGIATAVTARAGEYAQPGMPLLTVLAPRQVFMEAAAPQRDAARIHLGQAARIWLDTDPGRPIPGVVSQVLGLVGDARAVPVHIRLAAGRVRLSPGTTARAEVELTGSTAALMIPVDAVRSEGNASFVYVVANGRAERRNPVLGATEGSWVQVVAGLASGDQVILSGSTSLQPGVAVEPVAR